MSFKAEIEELEKELKSIEEAAIAHAKAHGISKITGSEFFLRISEQTDLQFPLARKEERENLERYLKKSGSLGAGVRPKNTETEKGHSRWGLR